jgi:transcriptional regulator with XRE-family HTH domain
MGRTTQRECGTAGRRGPDKERPAAWSAYGKLVRLFRERAGLTQQALADAIGYSMEQVASVEQGRRPAKAAFTEAVSRFSYDPMLVPGLLQTEAYAQALLEAHFPPLDGETVEQRVAARMARQSLLTRRNPQLVFVFIVEESAIRRVIGNTAVMREQLTSLLECSARRNVELQIMPTARGAHSGLNGPMVLLESTDRKQHVYVEAQDIVSVRSDRHEVSEFWLRYGTLRTQALNTEESSCLIERMVGEL